MSASEVSVSLDIPAPPQRVWDVVTDVTVMPRFSSELHHVEWDDGFSGAGLGARFLGTNRHRAVGEWTTRCEIVEFEPCRAFGWAVGDPAKPAAIWSFALSPTEAGTRLTYTGRIGPGSSGVTMLIEREPDRAAEIVANRLEEFRAGIAATLAGIRELVTG